MPSTRFISTMTCASCISTCWRISCRSSRMKASAWSAFSAVSRCLWMPMCLAQTISGALSMCRRRGRFPRCASTKPWRRWWRMSVSSCRRSLQRRQIFLGMRFMKRSITPCWHSAWRLKAQGAGSWHPWRRISGAPISPGTSLSMAKKPIMRSFLQSITRI